MSKPVQVNLALERSGYWKLDVLVWLLCSSNSSSNLACSSIGAILSLSLRSTLTGQQCHLVASWNLFPHEKVACVGEQGVWLNSSFLLNPEHSCRVRMRHHPKFSSSSFPDVTQGITSSGMCPIPAWVPRDNSTKPLSLGGWWARQDFGHKSLSCLKKELHPYSGIRTNNHSSAGKAALWKGQEAVWLSLSVKHVHSQICQGAVPSRGIWGAFSRASPKSSWLPRCWLVELHRVATEGAKQWDLLLGQNHSWQPLCLVFLAQRSTKAHHRGDLCELY